MIRYAYWTQSRDTISDKNIFSFIIKRLKSSIRCCEIKCFKIIIFTSYKIFIATWKKFINIIAMTICTVSMISSNWWCCQLTDLVYDGVFEVLQWLLFLSAVPPVQLLTGWCVTAKAPPDISAISALTAVKHGNCSSLTPLLNPVRTRKSLIWPWMALDAGQQPALWALASTRFYVT